jgi:hypothetical protein
MHAEDSEGSIIDVTLEECTAIGDRSRMEDAGSGGRL